MQSLVLLLLCAATSAVILDTRCFQEINPGPCKGYEPRYAYDSSIRQCVPFTYGGCFGNDNNFLTKRQCERTCKTRRPGNVVIIVPGKPDVNVNPLPIYPVYPGPTEPDSICTLPLESGPCRAYMPRYGFDASRGRCVRFIYGGCQGNENNFLTKAECQTACLANIPMPARF